MFIGLPFCIAVCTSSFDLDAKTENVHPHGQAPCDLDQESQFLTGKKVSYDL